MVRPIFGVVVTGVMLVSQLISTAAGQSPSPRPPVIDMHVHSTSTSPQETLARMKSLNIRSLFVSSLTADLTTWARALDATRFLPALVLPCDGGRAPITGRPCWDGVN